MKQIPEFCVTFTTGHVIQTAYLHIGLHVQLLFAIILINNFIKSWNTADIQNATLASTAVMWNSLHSS